MNRKTIRTGAVTVVALAAALVLLGGRVAQAAAQSGYSPRALVAEADAALAAGHAGVAILALERAHLLAPRSAVVSAQLAHAREVANLPPVQTGRVMRVARFLSGPEWSHVALGGMALGAVGVILLSWRARRTKRAAFLAIGGLAVASLGLLAAESVTPSRGEAVVVAADGTARIAPFPSAEPAFAAPDGAPVTIVRAHGDYVLVSASEGQGWLPRASVQPILPPDNHRS